MVGEGRLKQPQRRGFRIALPNAVNPELSLETCNTTKGSVVWAIFGGHCYLWGIGREVSTMETLEKDRAYMVWLSKIR